MANSSTVIELIDNSSDLTNEEAGELLHQYLSFDDLRGVKHLLRNYPLANLMLGSRGTPLLAAVLTCQVDAFEMLLLHGSDPNSVDSQGRGALFHALQLREHPDRERLIRLLLLNGADVLQTDGRPQSPLEALHELPLSYGPTGILFGCLRSGKLSLEILQATVEFFNALRSSWSRLQKANKHLAKLITRRDPLSSKYLQRIEAFQAPQAPPPPLQIILNLISRFEDEIIETHVAISREMREQDQIAAYRMPEHHASALGSDEPVTVHGKVLSLQSIHADLEAWAEARLLMSRQRLEERQRECRTLVILSEFLGDLRSNIESRHRQYLEKLLNHDRLQVRISRQALREEGMTPSHRKPTNDSQLAKELQGETFFCSLCTIDADDLMGVHLMDDKFIISECDHSACRACITRWANAQISEGRLPVTCYHQGCDKIISDMELSTILAPDAFALYERNLCKRAYTSGFWHCPQPDCPGVVDIDDPERVRRRVVCPVCDVAACIPCAVAWHDHLTCQQYQHWRKENAQGDSALQELAQREGWKDCPRCKLYIERSEGCNHLTCTCGTHFCYLCGVVLDSADPHRHFNETPCLLFPIPDEHD